MQGRFNKLGASLAYLQPLGGAWRASAALRGQLADKNLDSTERFSLGGPNGDCLVWQADNGQSYYLYQNALLENNSFDRINTPGVTSRLVIAIRNDLPAGCRADNVAEVNQVLEVAP